MQWKEYIIIIRVLKPDPPLEEHGAEGAHPCTGVDGTLMLVSHTYVWSSSSLQMDSA